METEAVVRVCAAGGNVDLRRTRTTTLGEETCLPPSATAEIPGVCRRVRELRAEMGWTQDDVARRTGVSRDSVGRIERGQLPDPIFLGELSRVACVSCDWLILGSEEASAGDEAKLFAELGDTLERLKDLAEKSPEARMEPVSKRLDLRPDHHRLIRKYEQMGEQRRRYFLEIADKFAEEAGKDVGRELATELGGEQPCISMKLLSP
ncbi:MAG: helix-turn-helix domain-containing protein [Deferrisomatales bacterium]|nr:helix-turn-helix domain-containing protein [Deferrisomatales bacterium]